MLFRIRLVSSFKVKFDTLILKNNKKLWKQYAGIYYITLCNIEATGGFNRNILHWEQAMDGRFEGHDMKNSPLSF